MTQVFHDASKDAGYCQKCQKGYAIGPHVCPTELLPSKDVSAERLSELLASCIFQSETGGHGDGHIAFLCDLATVCMELQRHRAAPEPPDELQAAQRTFWVVEKFENGIGGRYWDGGNSRSFETDIDKAVQFSRKSDAMWATRGWHWSDTKLTEHMMLDTLAPPPGAFDLQRANELADAIVQRICDSPDHTSPDDDPQLLCAYPSELHTAIVAELENEFERRTGQSCLATPPPAAALNQLIDDLTQAAREVESHRGAWEVERLDKARAALRAAYSPQPPEALPAQSDVLDWAVRSFGPIAMNIDERAARVAEEAIEIAQVEGVPLETVKRIADRVYSRAPGERWQEIGGTMIGMLSYAQIIGLSLADCTHREFQRVLSKPREWWQKKHAEKVAAGTADLSPCSRPTKGCSSISTDKTYSSGIENCRLCGSFALQSLNQQGMYSVHCFNEFSTETFDCDAPVGPESKSSSESIRLWNERQCPELGERND
jgi:hypothetical protein